MHAWNVYHFSRILLILPIVKTWNLIWPCQVISQNEKQTNKINLAIMPELFPVGGMSKGDKLTQLRGRFLVILMNHHIFLPDTIEEKHIE